MSINLDIKQGFVSMGNHNMDYANAQESMNLFAHGRSVAYGNTYDESYDYLKKYIKVMVGMVFHPTIGWMLSPVRILPRLQCKPPRTFWFYWLLC